MTRPTWHTLPLRTVTPAFLGHFESGPDSDGTRKEIPFPIPSLRGVLAYWLRALAGPYIGSNATELLRVESELFGAASDGTAAPSRILLRGSTVTVAELATTQDGKTLQGLRYLMGPGLIDEKSPSGRCLSPGQLDVRVKNLGGLLHADLFLSALWALRTFGGIGARTRRGFGTLSIGSVKNLGLAHSPRFNPKWLAYDRLSDLDAIVECVRGALRDLGFTGSDSDAIPAYPCFASDAYHAAEHTLYARNVRMALDATGDQLRTFRHPKAEGWAPANGWQLPNTAGFREVVQPYMHGRPSTAAFVDGALGLPIVYSGKGISKPITVGPIVEGKLGRRASPLWLRVANIDNTFKLRSLALHSEWLPADIALHVRSGSSFATVKHPDPAAVRAQVEAWFTHLDAAAIDANGSVRR